MKRNYWVVPGIDNTPRNILELICHLFGITEEQLFSGSRERNITDARFAYRWVLKKMGLKQEEIASRTMCKRSNVANTLKTLDNLVETDRKIRDKIDRISTEMDKGMPVNVIKRVNSFSSVL